MLVDFIGVSISHFSLSNIMLYTLKKKVKLLVSQLCLTLCDPMVYSPQGSSVHGILQARILECVAIPFSRGSFQPLNIYNFICQLYLKRAGEKKCVTI